MWRKLMLGAGGACVLALSCKEASPAGSAGVSSSSHVARIAPSSSVSALPPARRSAAPRQPNVEEGAKAWAELGCQVCHGARAEGGMGPQLAGRVPEFSVMLQQVRRGSPAMPPFAPERLSEATLLDIRTWLEAQPKPGVPDPNPDLIEVPPGVDVALVAHGLKNPVALAWRPAPSPGAKPELYVSTNGGWYPGPRALSGAIHRVDAGGRAHLFVDKLDRPMGMVWVDGKLYVSTRKRVSVFVDANHDGRGELERVIVDDLPGDGMHHAGSLVVGPDRRLYLGMGTRTNADIEGESPENGTILSFELDGSKRRVFARGFRNPFDLAFAPDGALFATDNAADPPFVEAAVEELNHVVEGGHYGHPFLFGKTPAPGRAAQAARLDTIAPVVELPPHTSANGILYYSGRQFPDLEGHWLIAEYGSHLKGYAEVGRRIIVVPDVRNENRREVELRDWATGFSGRPLDIVQDGDGAIYVTDFFQGSILRFFKSNRERRRVRPSFDCRYAKGPVELSLCRVPELSALDLAIDTELRRLKRDAGAAYRAELAAHQRWVKQRNACAKDAYVVECLKMRLTEQLSRLKQAGTPAP